MTKKKTAYTMTRGQLFSRMFENYHHIIPRYTRAQRVEAYHNPDKRIISGKMTNSEYAWAEKFEQLEYAIEKGDVKTAMRLETELRGRDITDNEAQAILDAAQIKLRCNPAKAEAFQRGEAKRKKTDRKQTESVYTPDDWVRQQFKVDPKTDKVYEVALSLNPEDALIEALDAAATHGVSLEDFINNPQYHTPERKAGRPKKETKE